MASTHQLLFAGLGVAAYAALSSRKSGTSSSSTSSTSSLSPLTVVIITSSQPQPRGTDAAPPLALTLAPGSHGTLLDGWWAQLKSKGLLVPSRVFMATNAQFYKYFEYEAFGRSLPVRQIVNSGRSLGDNRVDWRTVSLALKEAITSQGPSDALLLAADSAPPAGGLDLGGLLRQAQAGGRSAILTQQCAGVQEGGGPVCAVGMKGERGVASLSLSTKPPSPGATHFAPIFYYLTGEDVAFLLSPQGEEALAATCAKHSSSASSASASTTVATLSEPVVPVEAAMATLASLGRVVGLPIPGVFALGAMNGASHRPFSGGGGGGSGSRGWGGPYAHSLPRPLTPAHLGTPSRGRGYARVGLLGNPSDGYGGKTLAVTVENFYAEAWITPLVGGGGGAIHLLPHPLGDPLRYPTLGHLSTLSAREGYSGGLRLMAATLHRFHALATLKCFPLDRSRGFTARYHTTVPRQVGLAGSSAIITAFLRALCAFYALDAPALEALDLTKDKLPAFVLSIESDELGITAGLQDRVVQSYECAVHMNFDPALIKAKGHGVYTPIPLSALPPLFLAYAADPSDSGRIHAPIKQRWLAGDVGVVSAMAGIASLADEGAALAGREPYATSPHPPAVGAAWAALFTRNFNARRALFGDPSLGKDNIRMIEIARECGASAKFPGSGGAVVGVVDVQGMVEAGKVGGGSGGGEAGVAQATEVLRKAYHKEGYVFIRLSPHAGTTQ